MALFCFSVFFLELSPASTSVAAAIWSLGDFSPEGDETCGELQEYTGAGFLPSER